MQPILALCVWLIWEKRQQRQLEKKKKIIHTYCKLRTLSATETIQLNGGIIQCKGFGSRRDARGAGVGAAAPAAAKLMFYVKKNKFSAIKKILKYIVCNFYRGWPLLLLTPATPLFVNQPIHIPDTIPAETKKIQRPHSTPVIRTCHPKHQN